MGKNVAIIGGGFIGLCCAYYLNKAGHQVTVFDRGGMNQGCSYGNAGLIVPSHIIPLASPGVISQGFKWLLRPSSPFAVYPTFSMDFLKWGVRFTRSATRKHVAKSIPALKEISTLSLKLHQEIVQQKEFEAGFRNSGLLMLYKTSKAEEEENHIARQANQAGIEAQTLSASEIEKLEPNIQVDVKGGVFYPGDANISPNIWMQGIQNLLKNKGVRFCKNSEVTGFTYVKGYVKNIQTKTKNYSFDEIVLTGGVWSGKIAQWLGLKILLQPGKGYGFSWKVENSIQTPAILSEARVAVTPYNSYVRFGGAMEIGGNPAVINYKKVEGMFHSILKYYPGLSIKPPQKEEIWWGLRPLSFDGLPYLGKPGRYSNLTIATGHSMLGISLGPATGKLVEEIISGKKQSIKLLPFHPDR